MAEEKEYDYQTRREFENRCYDKWKQKFQTKIAKLNGEKKKIFRAIENVGQSSLKHDKDLKKFYEGYCRKVLGKNQPFRMEYDFQSEEFSLSQMMKNELADIVEIFVPEEFLEDYYHIIDEFVTYQYATGYTRRTVRTRGLDQHYIHAFGLMYGYTSFGFFHTSVADYITNHLTEEQIDYVRNSYGYGKIVTRYMDDIIAARINAGDESVIQAIKDGVLSENNTVIVSVEMIRAVIKCKNTELHELLLKYLLAAKLQEGVRQAVCENADCGRGDAFITILKGIKDENLLRYASVRRAVATWTGFIGEDSIERISNKVLEGMLLALESPDGVSQMLSTDDTIQMITALWAIGSYEVVDVVHMMIEIGHNGTKNQILTCAFYDQILQSDDFEREFSYPMIEKYKDDPEIVAALLSGYLADPSMAIRTTFTYKEKNVNRYTNQDAAVIYERIPVTEYFKDVSEAKKHFQLLKDIYKGMSKKKIEFHPCIFPWNTETLTKGNLVERMGLIAYILQNEELINEVCGKLSDIDGTYDNRNVFIEALLHAPQNDLQRRALLGYVADKETYSRKIAYALVKKLSLTGDEYQILEGYLKYKTQDIRTNVINLLKLQDEEGLRSSVIRLLESDKELIRVAGLDIVKSTYFDGTKEISEDKKAEYKKLVKDTVDVEALTEQEKMLYDEIVGSDGANRDVTGLPGYGLYDPDEEIIILSGNHSPENDCKNILPDGETETDKQEVQDGSNKNSILGSLKKLLAGDNSVTKPLKEYFDVPVKELNQHFKELSDFLDSHATMEYKGVNGDTRILGNGLYLLTYGKTEKYHESYPFPELWKEFYETYIHSEKLFWNMYFACKNGYRSTDIKDYGAYRNVEKEIFLYCGSDYHIPDGKHFSNQNIHSDYPVVLSCIRSIFDLKLDRELAAAFCKYAAGIPNSVKWMIESKERADRYYHASGEPGLVCFLRSEKFYPFLFAIRTCSTDEEYREWFELYRMLDVSYNFLKNDSTPDYYTGRSNNNLLSVDNYIKAYTLGQVSKNSVYKFAFEEIPLVYMVESLGKFAPDALTYMDLRNLQPFIGVDLKEKTCDTSDEFYKFGQEMYLDVMNVILDVELKRGDSETVFSKAGRKLRRIYGIERLAEILTALGKDVLDRNTYYYYGDNTERRACLCSLLQKCYPTKADSAEVFKKTMKERKISDDRIIEIAMYAPQWMDFAQEYLGCDGFKSGCYYFMAHMNESFDDKKKAMISKFTPLDAEELNAGAFDVAWFFECYEKLGEKMFNRLYKAAKYISDGAKHGRARKYADAALGKVTLEELEKQVEDKRNKDVLMSCGIVPIVDEADELHRYEFFQKFLKESKQFGAQRRASEAKAVEMALRNLAGVAGYGDSFRLVLAMETALVSNNTRYFEGVEIGDYVVRISVDENGHAALVISKKGKQIKSVPAPLKKNEEFLAMKEFHTKLKDQWSRSVKMFENAMEEREIYSASELAKLCGNPVLRAIITGLIFVKSDEEETSELYRMGEDGSLMKIDAKEEEFVTLTEQTENLSFRIAHPVDLFQSGKWSVLQQIFLKEANETGKKQPFKQVFRELYVKLPEEGESSKSRMFAGHQIQPKKTVGALKNRRWIADYEDGLQKIYYKDNIIATIYAMADWFSPSDVEAPTLEYVAFYNRKTFEPIQVKDVPDIVYSEVMRDVDLAVSVAHVGGVDPETSHSTIEMRKVIFEFNAKLFKLSNVHFEDTHAYIDGKYGKYTIQLGSGVIHKMGSHMINVLPVHSQSRGKIFLPFVDEDPKAAEIMSKILLFSQDDKIKDPYIMDQILRN